MKLQGVLKLSREFPLKLVEEPGLRDQRADWLKSRPRFNDTYFDGQRDPNEGRIVG